jgi:PilZ domain
MFAADPVRRAFRRYVRLDCQVVREHDLTEVADLALDLSTKGMLVRARKRVLTGEEVIVTFRPPRSNTYVDAPATVARVLHGRRPGDYGSVCLGLEFYGMRADEEQFLFEQLRGMSAPDAMRPPRTLAPRTVRAA